MNPLYSDKELLQNCDIYLNNPTDSNYSNIETIVNKKLQANLVDFKDIFDSFLGQVKEISSVDNAEERVKCFKELIKPKTYGVIRDNLIAAKPEEYARQPFLLDVCESSNTWKSYEFPNVIIRHILSFLNDGKVARVSKQFFAVFYSLSEKEFKFKQLVFNAKIESILLNKIVLNKPPFLNITQDEIISWFPKPEYLVMVSLERSFDPNHKPAKSNSIEISWIKAVLNDMRGELSISSVEMQRMRNDLPLLAILHAIKATNLPLLKLLMKSSPDTFKANHEYIVMWAAKYGSSEVCEMLLDVSHDYRSKQLDPTKNNNILFELAFNRSLTGVLDKLLNDDHVINSVNFNAVLLKACEQGNFKGIKFLLSRTKAEAHANNNEPLRIAVHKGNVEFVRFLLEKPNVDPAVNDNELVKFASKREKSANYKEILDLLINHGAELSVDDIMAD